MVSAAVDGAVLVAAAVRAAVQAKVPRRTVSAVAAAVTSALVRTVSSSAAYESGPVEAAGRESKAAEAADGSPEELLAKLRAVRAAQRRRKKQRRKLGKEAAKSAAQEGGEAAMPEARCDGDDGENLATSPCAAAAVVAAIPRADRSLEARGLTEPPSKLQRVDGNTTGARDANSASATSIATVTSVHQSLASTARSGAAQSSQRARLPRRPHELSSGTILVHHSACSQVCPYSWHGSSGPSLRTRCLTPTLSLRSCALVPLGALRLNCPTLQSSTPESRCFYPFGFAIARVLHYQHYIIITLGTTLPLPLFPISHRQNHPQPSPDPDPKPLHQGHQ